MKIDYIVIAGSSGGHILPSISLINQLAKLKKKIYEVGISYNGRTIEEGKKIKLKDGFLALYCILKYKFFN